MAPVGPPWPPGTTIKVTPVATKPLPVSALRTEFGRLLETVMVVPGALAVVLSDDRGYAIDFVFNGERVSEIDVQLIGAQLGQPLVRLLHTATQRNMADALVIAESEDRRLVCTTLAGEYVLAAMLAGRTNLALAIRRFDSAALRLRGLLEL